MTPSLAFLLAGASLTAGAGTLVAGLRAELRRAPGPRGRLAGAVLLVAAAGLLALVVPQAWMTRPWAGGAALAGLLATALGAVLLIGGEGGTAPADRSRREPSEARRRD